MNEKGNGIGNRRATGSAGESRPATAPRRRPLFLLVAAVLLVAWLVFMAAMAFMSSKGASVP
ncbi:MAG: hypothetical protein DCC68_07145 [Planctomycetota bacterium]|nr:MAG: hypothetical protein DCC68_07145 [Planctomycetota bacterium]